MGSADPGLAVASLVVDHIHLTTYRPRAVTEDSSTALQDVGCLWNAVPPNTQAVVFVRALAALPAEACPLKLGLLMTTASADELTGFLLKHVGPPV